MCNGLNKTGRIIFLVIKQGIVTVVFMAITEVYRVNRIMSMKALLGLVDAVNGLEAVVVVKQGKLEEDF